MKKIVLLTIMSVVLILGTGCSQSGGETSSENPVLKEELSVILETIYEKSGIELPSLANTELTEENEAYYIGTNDVAYIEAVASEPMMSSIAHSVVLLRVEEGADIEKIKETIKTKVDPRKWICVGVEEEDVIVDNIGNLVILIMINDSTQLHDAFLTLAE